MQREVANFSAIFDLVSDDLNKLKSDLEFELAKGFCALLKANIKNNKFKFRNTPRTEDEKLKRGNGMTPLIDTGEYFNAIYQDKNSVTVKNGLHHSGITYGELQMILEYGRMDKLIAPYAVWRKTLEEFDQKYVDEIVDTYMKKYA
jgi:hypothetical protein